MFSTMLEILCLKNRKKKKRCIYISIALIKEQITIRMHLFNLMASNIEKCVYF